MGHDDARRTDTLPPAAPDRLERLRAEAAARLATIAATYGAGSALHRHCQEVWAHREAMARASLAQGDAPNAATILEHGVHVLTFGPALVSRAELELDDVLMLLACG